MNFSRILQNKQIIHENAWRKTQKFSPKLIKEPKAKVRN